MIILNEKEFAITCLDEGALIGKPTQALSIIARYYYHCLGYRKKKIVSLLTDFVKWYFPPYRDDMFKWDDLIDKIAGNAHKKPLCEITDIWITQAELDKIATLNSKLLERLAFTYLCLAKYANIKSPSANSWVNQSDKEIFSLARVSLGSYERNVRIGMLEDLGFLEASNQLTNLSSRVTFINENSEKVLRITDFRELGYEYLKYKGGNFIRCGSCGVLTKGNKTGTKRYCDQCVQYTPQVYKTIECIDCGEEFDVPAKNNRSKRCPACQKEKQLEYQRNSMAKARNKM